MSNGKITRYSGFQTEYQSQYGPKKVNKSSVNYNIISGEPNTYKSKSNVKDTEPQNNNYHSMQIKKKPINEFNNFQPKTNNINMSSKFGNNFNNCKTNTLPFQMPAPIKRNKFINIKAKGLPNVGLSCYMNAVLQCLFYISEFSETISELNLNPNCQQLAYRFKRIIEYLCKNEDSYGGSNYYPYSNYGNKSEPLRQFKDEIAKDELFRNLQPSDAKDLVMFLLINMHNELNVNRDKMVPSMDPKGQLDEMLTLNYIGNKFILENKSIISDLFFGFSKYKYYCTVCEETLYNFQIYNFIEVPLMAVYNSKGNSSGYNNYYKKEVNLMDYFEYISKPSQSYMLCTTKCNKETLTTSKERYYLFPNVLVIFLNYGKNASFMCDVNFQETLDLSKIAEHSLSPKSFGLRGVICHRGTSGASGHYVAYCKHFNNLTWNCFDDDHVSPANFGNWKLHGELPYVLFYEKK